MSGGKGIIASIAKSNEKSGETIGYQYLNILIIEGVYCVKRRGELRESSISRIA